jgi:hypothetical protein
MSDDEIEKHLRALPAPELPPAWREEILAAARREERAEKSPRAAWPPILVVLRNVLARNPVTSGILATLWLLIFLFRFTTPIDPDEKNFMADAGSNRPIYFVSLRDEIQLADLLQEQPEPKQPPRIP